jgi:hypothetical protein
MNKNKNMKVKFTPDSENIAVSSVHGEYTTDGEQGWRSVDVTTPWNGFERLRVRVSNDDMDVIDDPTFFDRICSAGESLVDESECPELADRIRSSSRGYVIGDGGEYSLIEYVGQPVAI